MAWPPAITAEIFINGAWTDVTSYLYVRNDIVITRGARDEASRPDPQTCSFTLNNRSGNWSPRNPVGIWYGLIGRNVPIRFFDHGNPLFAGELSKLPQRWDLSGLDVYVPAEAAGIRKRLGQGNSPLKSTLYRGNTTVTPAPVAYWPCEEGDGATSIGSAIGGYPMTVSGTTNFGQYSDIPASSPLPVLQAAYWDGLIAPYTPPSPNKIQIRFIMVAPTSPEIPDDSYLVDLHNTGTAGLWRIKYGTTGDLRLEVWSSAFAGGPDILNDGFVDFNTIGKRLLVSLELTQNGANIDWNLATLEVGQVNGLVTSGTVNSKTINVASRVFVDPLKVCQGLVIGHISVRPTVTSLFDLSSELNAFTGERSGRRLERLCAQEGVSFVAGGDLDETPPMGPQRPKTLLDLLDEAADVDGGLLFEARDEPGFVFNTLASLYNKTPDLELDYSQAHINEPFEPLDDDFPIVNDVTAKGTEGGFARVYQDTGRLSVAEPKDGGVGRYDVELTFNVYDSGRLADLAAFAVGKGTIDKARYPEVTVNLGNPHLRDDGLDDAATLAGVNSIIAIDNMRSDQTPDQISIMAVGYSQTVSADKNIITFNCVPADLYEPLQVGTTGLMKIDNDTTTITGGPYSSSATSIQLASTGDLWSTSAGAYPADAEMAGEVVRITAMSGTSSPQTATVTRSINGVQKSQVNGTPVSLFRVPRVGL